MEQFMICKMSPVERTPIEPKCLADLTLYARAHPGNGDVIRLGQLGLHKMDVQSLMKSCRLNKLWISRKYNHYFNKQTLFEGHFIFTITRLEGRCVSLFL